MNLSTLKYPGENDVSSAYLLSAFRILFALLGLFSAIRFFAKGWIKELYLDPSFHFKYFGFEWVKLPESQWLVYALFTVMIISLLGILSGWFYRFWAALYFFLFTYFELIDKTYYLNHYYFISILALAMVFVPANAGLVFGNRLVKKIKSDYVLFIRVIVGVVYLYAGIAKLNSDWLFEAQPLSIWLNAFHSYGELGAFLASDTAAFTFSYAGCIFDLLVVFFLINSRTRVWAYLVALVFHTLTAILFPIGVFPYVMMVAALVFFPSYQWQKVIKKLIKLNPSGIYESRSRASKLVLITIVVLHILFPFRFVLYPSGLFWHEQGFRFSWRVMLMEKNGYTELTANLENGRTLAISNSDYLTPLQEKMMSTQPDFILEYAHYVSKQLESQGFKINSITADAWVSLNGRSPFRMIQNNVNLLAEKDGFHPYTWITQAP